MQFETCFVFVVVSFEKSVGVYAKMPRFFKKSYLADCHIIKILLNGLTCSIIPPSIYSFLAKLSKLVKYLVGLYFKPCNKIDVILLNFQDRNFAC